MFKFLVLFLISKPIVFSLESLPDNSLTCRDENGNAIDWFYLYKLPQDYASFESKSNGFQYNGVDAGLKYLYMTPETIESGWSLSALNINSSSSFAGRTVSGALNAKYDSFYVAYNDETPEGKVDFTNGHTKGILSGDLSSGFWLIHSVPKYPTTDAYRYPPTGRHYGQSFLCISLNATQLNVVGEQLIYNEPNIYYSKISDSLKSKYPKVVAAIGKNWRKEPPYWNDVDFISLAGIRFHSFAKGRNFKKELYEDWVAPILNVNLFVESWRHGPDILPTNCTKSNHVLNIQNISLQEDNISFKTTADHSKWSVSDENSENWICVGDINRSKHQLERGGGTVCQLNSMIAHHYRKLIRNVEPCPRN